MKTGLVICLLAALSAGECKKKNTFTNEDLGEIAGLVGYMIARFAKELPAYEARKIQSEARESSYVSSVYNIFTGERVLTNAMVTEAVGDICYYNSKLRGDTPATSKDKKAECRNSAYTRYDWEKAFFEGKFTPPKELIEEAAGDFCYVSAKYIFGYSQRRSDDLYEECKRSHYVDYVYDAFDKHSFVPESRMISEAFGDICYHTCQLDRINCLRREKRCEKTQYVDLLYNLFQGKNKFTDANLDKITFDACYWYQKLVNGGTDRTARKLGTDCKKNRWVKMVKSNAKILIEEFWPIEDDFSDAYDY